MLPELYAAWLGQAFEGEIPEETKATCRECAMLGTAGNGHNYRPLFFNPTVKCCTYMPDLFNFLAGRALQENDPDSLQGRESVRKRLLDKVAVTPLGINQPHFYTLQYRANSDAFGQNEELRCPHYLLESGRCGIWRNRSAVCSTWYCKTNRGATGWEFWKIVFQLLNTVEINLSRWCVLELGLETQAIKNLFPLSYNAYQSSYALALRKKSKDSAAEEEHYRKVWGNWLDREEEFFVKCAALVNPLTWQNIIEICGPELRAYEKLAREAYGNIISQKTRDKLYSRPFRVISSNENSVLTLTYSNYDPLSIPLQVADSLRYFDGRPVAQVLQEIKAEKGVNLTPGLVSKLADFGILGDEADAILEE